jgi:hypothetical protein
MSLEDLKKALEEKAVALTTIVQDFLGNDEVVFASGYVAHKNDKLLLIKYVLDVLDDYVLVPRKQLSEAVEHAHKNAEYWKDKDELRQIWVAVELSYKQLFEATQ